MTAIVRLGEILVPASEAGPDNAGIETDVGSPQCVPLLDVRFAHPDLLCLSFVTLSTYRFNSQRRRLISQCCSIVYTIAFY